jgi:hypothetical protein
MGVRLARAESGEEDVLELVPTALTSAEPMRICNEVAPRFAKMFELFKTPIPAA